MSYDWNDLIPLIQKKDNYEPDPQEIIQYAQYLGLVFPQDQKYWPIVREGLLAPLPPFWQACETSSGELLFRNKKTRQIIESNPLDDLYRRKIEDLRRFQEMYGVEPINQESALRESSGILRSSKMGKSNLRIRNPSKGDYDPRSSLIERHITEESQYSEAGSVREGKSKVKDQIPQWKKQHYQKLEMVKASLSTFFPKPQNLIKSDGILQEDPSKTFLPLEKLKQLQKMRQMVANKKIQLERIRKEKKVLQEMVFGVSQ